MTDHQRVYLRESHKVHLLHPSESVNIGYPLALCKLQPQLGDSWRGTGSQNEINRARSLPLCRKCAARQ